MNIHTKRRQRRRLRAITTGKKRSVRRHRRKGGRTGSIRAKATPAKVSEYHRLWPNSPITGWGSDCTIGGPHA
jgi:hypothetical protein